MPIPNYQQPQLSSKQEITIRQPKLQKLFKQQLAKLNYNQQLFQTYQFNNNEYCFNGELNSNHKPQGLGILVFKKSFLPDSEQEHLFPCIFIGVFQDGNLSEGVTIYKSADYKDGWKYEGKFKDFLQEDSNPMIQDDQNYIIKVGFKEGRKHGKMEGYYDNGKIWYEKQFEDGIENGIQKWYQADGQLRKTCYLKHNKLFGREIVYTSYGNSWQHKSITYSNQY